MCYSSWVICSFQKGFFEDIKAWWQEISVLIAAWRGKECPHMTQAFRMRPRLVSMVLCKVFPVPKSLHCLVGFIMTHASLDRRENAWYPSFVSEMCLPWTQEENSPDHKRSEGRGYWYLDKNRPHSWSERQDSNSLIHVISFSSHHESHEVVNIFMPLFKQRTEAQRG